MSLQSDLAAIIGVVGASELIQAESRLMVTTGLLHASCALAERHVYQTQFLDVTHQLLTDAQRRAAEMQRASEASIIESESELTELRAAELAATTALEAVRAQECTKADVRAAAAKAVTEAELERKTAEINHKEVNVRMSELMQQKAHATSVSDGSFRMLDEGGWGDDEMRAACLEPVIEHLTQLQSEHALIAAAAKALEVRPETRQEFDLVTISCVSEVLAKHVADTNAKVAECSPEESQASAEALGFWALADVLRDRDGEATDALGAAAASVKAGVAEEAAARRRVEDSNGLLATRRKAHEDACHRVKGFDEALDALKRIVHGSYEMLGQDGMEVGEEEDIVMGAAAQAPVTTKDVATSVQAFMPAPLGA